MFQSNLGVTIKSSIIVCALLHDKQTKCKLVHELTWPMLLVCTSGMSQAINQASCHFRDATRMVAWGEYTLQPNPPISDLLSLFFPLLVCSLAENTIPARSLSDEISCSTFCSGCCQHRGVCGTCCVWSGRCSRHGVLRKHRHKNHCR